MGNLDGSGVYRQDAILGPFPEPANTSEVCVPHIEEIRAVEHDGETYFNAKDLAIAMKMMQYKVYPTLSVFHFVKMFTFQLITARR
jgi:hypothetical protein